MTKIQRAAQVFMVMIGLITIFFYSSAYADTSDSAIPGEDKALFTMGGVGLGVSIIALATAGINSGERWAWLALWVLPAFLIAHIVLLGSWIPHGILSAISIAAMIVTRPRNIAA